MTQTAAAPISQLVAGYREQVARDPESHDGDSDVAYWLLQDTAGRSWTPSELARALKIDTHAARELLQSLAAADMIAGDGRGAWTRYSAR
jgi:hypothetical protein